MRRNRILLDADPSIIEKNLMITNQEDEELKHLFPIAREETPSKLVKPSPGFCVKTRSNDDKKIFINICQTDAIPTPDDISEEQLMEILQSETPSEFRVPMSIGEARTDTDKAGNPATTYDVAINPHFFVKVENNTLFKQFLLTIIFEGLQDKYGVDINMEEFTILKNRKVMGDLQYHRIRQRDVDTKMNKPKKLIEELDVPTTPLNTSSQSNFHKIKVLDGVKEPPYKLMKQNFGENGDSFIADFYIPDIMSVNDINLDIGEDRLVLESKKRGYFLDIFLPSLIKQDNVEAKLNKNIGILTVTVPTVESA